MKPLQVIPIVLAVALPIAVVVFWVKAAGGVERAPSGPWNRPLADRRVDPFPRTYSNGSGESVQLMAPPKRIVSATIFGDAMLLALCPAERIVSLHTLSRDPRYSPIAAASAAFPRHSAGGPEEILALSPDCVIISSFSRKETRNLLQRTGCAVLRFQGFSSVADIESNIRAVGYALGLDDGAEELVANMRVKLRRVAGRADERRPWRLLHYAGGYTSGADTTFDSLLQFVGAHNVATELGLVGAPALRPEDMLLMAPDAIVVGVEPGGEAALGQRLRQIPGFASLDAVQRDRLLFVPNALLLSTSQHIVDAAVVIADRLDEWGRP